MSDTRVAKKRQYNEVDQDDDDTVESLKRFKPLGDSQRLLTVEPGVDLLLSNAPSTSNINVEQKGCLLSALPSVLITHVTSSFLSDSDVASLSVTCRSLCQPLGAVCTERKVARLAAVRASLGVKLGLTAKETKGLWEAMSADNSYWHGTELLRSLNSKLIDPDVLIQYHSIEMVTPGDNVELWLLQAGFMKKVGYRNTATYQRGLFAILELTRSRKTTGFYQYDHIQLDAHQLDLPQVDLGLRPTGHYSFVDLLNAIQGNIRRHSVDGDLCYDVFELKWSYKHFFDSNQRHYRLVFLNNYYVCTQWLIENDEWSGYLGWENQYSTPDQIGYPFYQTGPWHILHEGPSGVFPKQKLLIHHPAAFAAFSDVCHADV